MEIKSQQMPEKADEISFDFIRMVILLKTNWRQILCSVLVGLVSAAFLFSQVPKKYMIEAWFDSPSRDTIFRLSNQSLLGLNRKEITTAYVSKLRSLTNLDMYLEQFGYYETIAREEFSELNREALLYNVTRAFTVEKMDDLDKDKRSLPEYSVSLVFKNGRLASQIVNGYLSYTETMLKRDLETESMNISRFMLDEIDVELATLREREKIRKLQEIKALEAANEQKLAGLKQKIALLMENGLDIKKLEITKLENEMALKLDKLKQERKLLLELSQKEIANDLSEAKEALVIAKEMGIKEPKTINDFTSDDVGASKTVVSLNANVLPPLFMMGETYLNSYIKSLENKNSTALISERLANLDQEIETVQDNKTLQYLKNTLNDDLENIELIELREEIKRIESDAKLKSLKAQINDDSGIAKLPELMSEYKKIENIEFDLEDLHLMNISKAATPYGIAVYKSLPVFLLFGAGLGSLVGIIWTLIGAGIRSKKEVSIRQ